MHTPVFIGWFCVLVNRYIHHYPVETLTGTTLFDIRSEMNKLQSNLYILNSNILL